jgi:hypothetical protein
MRLPTWLYRAVYGPLAASYRRPVPRRSLDDLYHDSVVFRLALTCGGFWLGALLGLVLCDIVGRWAGWW